MFTVLTIPSHKQLLIGKVSLLLNTPNSIDYYFPSRARGVSGESTMELHLISSSDSLGLPSYCDLIFSVSDEIQKLREWQLWDADITPFRDR